MVRDVFARLSVVLAGTLLVGCCVAGTAEGARGDRSDNTTRLRRNIGFNWKFHRGEVENGEKRGLNVSSWLDVELPHDWSIEGPLAEDNPSGRQGGYFPGGIGWYRKALFVAKEADGKKVSIEFDGVYMNSDVWVNGIHLGRRPNGYIGFAYDLTPHIEFGKRNIIAVRADNSSQPNSRWYSGSGIYRHVWLTVTEKVHVVHWGTFVTTPQVSEQSATVRMRTTVRNETEKVQKVKIMTRLLDPDGELVKTAAADKAVSPGDAHEFDQTIMAPNPRLWSSDEPAMYRINTTLRVDNVLVDRYVTPLGIRTIRFDANKGFFLNEKTVKLEGVCIHHGAGCVGAAVPDQILERRLRILKSLGCNAIRTAHNPFSPVFYDLCDQMGFIVIDEVFDCWNLPKEGSRLGYNFSFDEWWERDLTDQIHRDRNHPCVIMWSVGNEIPGKGDPAILDTLIPMRDLVHKEDPTRPVTAGTNTMAGANASGFAEALDVVGYNGGGGSCFMYDDDHKTYPDRKMYGSEVPHSFQTRGVYHTLTTFRDTKKMERIIVPDLTEEEVFTDFHPSYNSSYDNSYVRINARDSWRLTSERDFMAGEFRWTGFDYLGESRGWPAKHYNAGVIDTCGFPKENFYFYKSRWTDEPMVHILPHWSWPGKEGVTIPVWAYTNCDAVELFLNGKSLGEQKMGNEFNLSWDVAYAPGTLKAIGKRAGKVVCEDTVHTAGKPARLVVDCDRETIRANGRDLVHIEVKVVDKKGRFVPNADNLVTFNIDGPAKLIGVDNGDSVDHTSYKLDHRKAFSGMCLAIVQSTREPGAIRVTASSKGLTPATAETTSTK